MRILGWAKRVAMKIVRYMTGDEAILPDDEAAAAAQRGMAQIVGEPDVGRAAPGEKLDPSSPYMKPQINPLGIDEPIAGEDLRPATSLMIGGEETYDKPLLNPSITNPDPWYAKAGGPPSLKTCRNRSFRIGDKYDDVAGCMRWMVVRPGTWDDSDEDSRVQWRAVRKILVNKNYEVVGFADDKARPAGASRVIADDREAMRGRVEEAQRKVDAELNAGVDKVRAAVDERPAWVRSMKEHDVEQEMPDPGKTMAGSQSFQKQLRFARLAALKEARRNVRDVIELIKNGDAQSNSALKKLKRASQVLYQMMEVEVDAR
jgi:hypothetical protein